MVLPRMLKAAALTFIKGNPESYTFSGACPPKDALGKQAVRR